MHLMLCLLLALFSSVYRMRVDIKLCPPSCFGFPLAPIFFTPPSPGGQVSPIADCSIKIRLKWTKNDDFNAKISKKNFRGSPLPGPHSQCLMPNPPHDNSYTECIYAFLFGMTIDVLCRAKEMALLKSFSKSDINE